MCAATTSSAYASTSGFTIVSSKARQSRSSSTSSTSSYVHHSGHTAPSSGPSNLATLSHLTEVPESLDPDSLPIAVPGEPLASSTLFMRGHGTSLTATGQITSTVAGTLVLTNKLLSIPPVRTRYLPEIGDLVVGQVTSLSPKRWKVDIHSRSDASLQLSSINLPGGVQRRKLESDELQMRTFFKENDWVVAEVQSVFNDGTVGLHTRSLRYGKLRNGTVKKVEAGRVRRLKSHFGTVSLPILGREGMVKLDVILGLNGYVWISKHVPFNLSKVEGEHQGMAGTGTGRDVDAVYTDLNEDLDADTREAIARTAKVVEWLDRWCVPISDGAIQVAYQTWCHLDPDNAEPLDEVKQVVVQSALDA
ncbi:Exosome complex component rrp4 [Thecaphora frezii]